MKKLSMVLSAWVLVACSSTSTPADPQAGTTPTDGDGGAIADASAGGDAAPAVDSGQLPASDAGSDACEAEITAGLGAVDAVSGGEVSVVSNADGVLTLYVDASAGGQAEAPKNPRVYIALDGQKASISDTEARTSVAWDLAFKRAVVLTNSGQVGPGQGGSLLLDGKAFDDVTSADAAGKTFGTEQVVSATCDANVDSQGAMRTSFDGWNDYDPSSHTLAPHPGTWLGKTAAGKLYKLAIVSYYATQDGGVGTVGGHYIVRLAPL